MLEKTFLVKNKVWLYPGDIPWHFVSVPTEISQNIDFYFAHVKRGFGSLPVTVTLGETSWQTSIFPDRQTNTYMLPLKVEVRKEENVRAGQIIKFSLKITE